MTEHIVTVGYTYMDDGVWLFCTCRWELNCDFSPTPQQLMDEQVRHLANPKKKS